MERPIDKSQDETGGAASNPCQGIVNKDSHKLLELPEEVGTLEAARILGCCRHTVLQLLADGLLEWRNAAPVSSSRPQFRLTLRSVLQLRLTYRTGAATPPGSVCKAKARSSPGCASGYQARHLRRKKQEPTPP
jgi:hypothetical protein